MSLLLLPILVLSTARSAPSERSIFQELERGYNILARPVRNASLPVRIHLGITLQNIIDMDEKNQILTLNVWLQYSWNDYRLMWEPREHENITDVRFPSYTLWKPDVLLYNSVDSKFDSSYHTNLVVSANGDVSWIPPGIFKLSCKIDITFYPFDIQTCEFKFGSWTLNVYKLDLLPDAVDMSEYMINGEWDVKEVYSKRDMRYYNCCPEPYTSVHFVMVMRRRTLFFGWNFIVPCMLMTSMCVLGFLVPANRCQKVTLQITICLSIVVFLTILSNMTPTTSEAIPILGIFFSVSFILVAVSVMFTVCAEVLYHAKPEFRTMGAMVELIFLNWVPWLTFMSRPGRHIARHNLWHLAKHSDHGLCDASLQKDDDTEQRILNVCQQLTARKEELHLDTLFESKIVLLYLKFRHMKTITSAIRLQDERSSRTRDWMFAADAVDRLCFILLSLMIAGSSCYIFFSAPYLTV